MMGQPALGWVAHTQSSNYNTVSDSNGDCGKSTEAPKTTSSGTIGGMSGGGPNRPSPVFYNRG